MAELSTMGIGKNRKNEGQKFMFRGIDDVYAALSPLLVKHGLTIVPSKVDLLFREERTTAKGGVNGFVGVSVTYTLSAGGESVTATMFGEGMDSADKATSKAISIAYKYLCFQVFCIPVQGQAADDPEADNHEVLPRGTPPISPVVQELIDWCGTQSIQLGREPAERLLSWINGERAKRDMAPHTAATLRAWLKHPTSSEYVKRQIKERL
jgi:hypothetical protein